jgi:hypothetical protein
MYLNNFIGGNVCATANRRKKGEEAQERGGGHSSLPSLWVNHSPQARIHSQFESLGFVGKYDQSPTKLVNSEIRGSGFSAKSSDFLPPKWSKNVGFRSILMTKVMF